MGNRFSCILENSRKSMKRSVLDLLWIIQKWRISIYEESFHLLKFGKSFVIVWLQGFIYGEFFLGKGLDGDIDSFDIFLVKQPEVILCFCKFSIHILIFWSSRKSLEIHIELYFLSKWRCIASGIGLSTSLYHDVVHILIPIIDWGILISGHIADEIITHSRVWYHIGRIEASFESSGNFHDVFILHNPAGDHSTHGSYSTSRELITLHESSHSGFKTRPIDGIRL